MSDGGAVAIARQAQDKATEAHVLAQINQERLNNHEEQCAERYQGILTSIAELKTWIIGAASTAIFVLIAAVGSLAVMWVLASINQAGA